MAQMRLSRLLNFILVSLQIFIATEPRRAAAFAAIGEGVEAGFPAGSGSTGRFFVGDDLLFECRAFGVINGLAVRLFCPLTRLPDGGSGGGSSIACFEDCSKPLCASAGSLEACRQRVPELADAVCSIDRRPAASGAAHLSEVVLTYRFRNASRRLDGSFACQYKQMRSQYAISVSEPTTSTSTSTTTTSTTTTTTTTTTKTPTTTTVVPTTTAAAVKTAQPETSPAAKAKPGAEAASSTKQSASTAARTTDSKAAPTTTAVPAVGVYIRRNTPIHAVISDTATGQATSATVTDWFDTEIIASLKNGHVLIAGLVLLILLIITLAVSLICWRRCFSSNAGGGRSRSRYRPPPQGRASAHGSVDGDTADLLLLQSRYSRPPPLLPVSRSRSGSRPGSAHSFVSSPIYNEPDVAASAAAAAAAAASNGDSASSDYYARPGPTAPPPAGGFFSRSQDGRHSFHSVGQPASRHRVNGRSGGGHGGGGAGGSSELLSGSRGGYGEATVGISVGGYGYGDAAAAEGADPQSVREMVRLLTEQGRELQQLSKQVRASQQALSRLAASYHDLHRSVSMSRVRHPSSSPRHSPIGGRQSGSVTGGASSSVATPDSTEDPYDAEVTELLPSAAQISAATESMTAEAAALGDLGEPLGGDSPGGDVDSTDGLASSASGRASTAASGLGFVETINEELEAEDATLKPNKQQNQQQQQQP
ncbi:hypothetical protein BOX15_Mlig018884g3 [Macrostomum lignano]|uniref:Uncharacterized protein n=1 Tax=Macrostomum lignano TaxID=282301 RepID=A0A267E0E7_9PLAT|nr:hypothetical protein BOX15_Mlig018884g3 [Macrostomum lignano]